MLLKTRFNRIPSVGERRDKPTFSVSFPPRLARGSVRHHDSKLAVCVQVIIAYLLAVIPLNWLICRFVFNRREWTWVVVTLVDLAFAIGVERFAVRDMGYEAACDEIALLEIHGDYPRAHLTGLVSLYTTGRSRFAISYPNDPTAPALPFDTAARSAAKRFRVRPGNRFPYLLLRTFRFSPPCDVQGRTDAHPGGPIWLEGEGDKRQVVNGSEPELRDATFDRSG